MKRVLIAVLMVSALLLTIGQSSTANAEEVIPEEYLNGGVLILGEYGVGLAWYLDKSSVRIEQEGPPQYIISFQMFPTRYDRNTGEITRVFDGHRAKCMYDVEKDAMYFFNTGFQPVADWAYIDPVGPAGESPIDTLGEMAWYILYQKPFYGGRKWKDGNGQMRWSNYGDELYRRIDNSY